MIKKGKFYGVVRDGKTIFDSKEVYNSWIKNLEGSRIEISVEKEKEKVTEEQWGWLYGCVYPQIAVETGYSIDEVDGVLKRKFLTLNKGTKKEYIKDKSKLSKAELSGYIDSVLQVAAELGINILPPNKNWKLNKGN